MLILFKSRTRGILSSLLGPPSKMRVSPLAKLLFFTQLLCSFRKVKVLFIWRRVIHGQPSYSVHGVFPVDIITNTAFPGSVHVVIFIYEAGG